VTGPTNPFIDRDRDVLVVSFNIKMQFAHRRKPRVERGGLWNVFLGPELIDHFENLDNAIALARKLVTKSGRQAWISTDGVTFETIDRV